MRYLIKFSPRFDLWKMSKVYVKAKPRAQKREVRQIDPPEGRTGELHFEVAVTEAPEKGLANKAVLKALAEYLDMPVSRLSVVSGAAWRNKIIEIE